MILATKAAEIFIAEFLEAAKNEALLSNRKTIKVWFYCLKFVDVTSPKSEIGG